MRVHPPSEMAEFQLEVEQSAEMDVHGKGDDTRNIAHVELIKGIRPGYFHHEILFGYEK